MLKYHSLAELNDLCLKKDKEMWEIVLQAELDESERTAEESTAKMLEMYHARQWFLLSDTAPEILSDGCTKKALIWHRSLFP